MTEIDIAQIRDELNDEVADFMIDAGNDFVNFVKLEAPIGATGDLRRSWQILRVEDGGERVVIGSPLSYASDVQFGRPPHEPDMDSLRVWARRKLNDEGAAESVADTIREEGTQANDYVGRAIDRLRRKYR